MTLPYSDELMTYDAVTKRYILTEYALSSNGMTIRERLSRKRGTPVSEIINRLTRRISELVYNYIHQFNVANNAQDELIAKSETLRDIIYRAMVAQAEYLLMNGDLSRSVDREKRAVAIDFSAKDILTTVVPELGFPITYTGYIGGC